MAGNAGNKVSIPGTDTVIFQPGHDGGSQKDGITSFTLKNQGATVILVNAQGFHEVGEYYPLDSGEAMTLGVDNINNHLVQIHTVTVKSETGTGKLSWGTTGRF